MAQTSGNLQLDSLVNRVSAGIEEDIAAVSVDVLIMGPNIEGKRLNGAAKVRKLILEKCKEFGARVLPVAAEHKKLIGVARKALGKGYNLCSYEMKLAKNCDLIVLIPGSAGSFVELGLFALEDEACSKSVIFFDRSHKTKSPSFIREGPRKSYKMRGALIHDVDYNETGKILSRLKSIIEQRKVVKAERKAFPR